MNREMQGLVFALVGTVLLSSKSVMVKLALNMGIEPNVLMGLRVITSLPFYFMLAIWLMAKSQFKVKRKLDLVYAGLLGICIYHAAGFLDVLGLQYISASLERLVLYVYPTFVLLLSYVFFRRPITPRDVLTLIVVYIGLALVFGVDLHNQGDQVIKGTALVMCAAMLTASFLLGSQKLAPRMGSQMFSCVAMMVSSATIFAQFLMHHSIHELKVGWELLFLVLLISVLGTILPSLMISAAVVRIEAARVSVIGCLGPVATVLLAMQFLDERLTLPAWVGMMLVIAGIFAQNKFKDKAQQS